ncbi:multicystatin-like [Rosa chinensis]|uniref:multicystatin-like n=1 Tax=Rosa chinensis TaxID=74649 RepID=UPI001AD944EE|nr:multicystatin-like [Rosa chinensis]
MDLGGLEPAARFAIEEFNKRKNAQLRFVRVVKAHRHLEDAIFCAQELAAYVYVITLEAVDASVAKLYQAKVSVNFTDGMFLEWFCLVVDDGCPIALFDRLENFFAQKDHEDKAENQIPMCKKQVFASLRFCLLPDHVRV